ncbi:MAG: hypothetical protein ABJG33_17085 [Balneola sp.]
MKNLVLLLSLFFLSCGVTESEPEHIVTKVWYVESDNMTWVEYSGDHYNGEKYAIIQDSTFLDLFRIINESDNRFNVERNFTHSIKIGMDISFTNDLY